MAIREDIAALYQSILGRPADEAGLNYFTNAVTSGAGTLADVARDMRASAEAEKYTSQQVSKLFENILGRPADEAGLNYFTNAVTSGAGTLSDVARDIAASQEAQGLLGTKVTTDGGTKVTTDGGTKVTTDGGLLGNVNAGRTTTNNSGYTMDAARNLVAGFYNTGLSRPPDAAGWDFWSNAIVSGQMSPADVYKAIVASPEGQGMQIGVRPVPFGSQAVGGNVYEMARYNAPQNMPPSIQNAFQQSLAYQAALPWMIPQFNPADIPATYQQIAQPRQRLDISNITVPQWLQDAAKKDQAVAATEDSTDAATAEKTTTDGKTTTTGGVTTTNVGSNSLDYLKNVPNWIINTYGGALGRLPEQSGAEYWAAQEKAGVPVADLIATIQNSPEALGRAGLLSK